VSDEARAALRETVDMFSRALAEADEEIRALRAERDMLRGGLAFAQVVSANSKTSEGKDEPSVPRVSAPVIKRAAGGVSQEPAPSFCPDDKAMNPAPPPSLAGASEEARPPSGANRYDETRKLLYQALRAYMHADAEGDGETFADFVQDEASEFTAWWRNRSAAGLETSGGYPAGARGPGTVLESRGDDTTPARGPEEAGTVSCIACGRPNDGNHRTSIAGGTYCWPRCTLGKAWDAHQLGRAEAFSEAAKELRFWARNGRDSTHIRDLVFTYADRIEAMGKRC
jgi:hypothetical protein